MKRTEFEKMPTEKKIQLSLFDKVIELEKVKQWDSDLVDKLGSKGYIGKDKMPK